MSKKSLTCKNVTIAYEFICASECPFRFVSSLPKVPVCVEFYANANFPISRLSQYRPERSGAAGLELHDQTSDVTSIGIAGAYQHSHD